MRNFYVIKELATGITMVVGNDLDEMKKIFKNFDKKYFILEDCDGKEVI